MLSHVSVDPRPALPVTVITPGTLIAPGTLISPPSVTVQGFGPRGHNKPC